MERRTYSQTPALIVSIHDVCPGSMERTREMLRDLEEVGIAACSLLVIPNRHKIDPAWEHPEFCRWLGETVAVGHEAVLHGYYHLRESRAEIQRRGNSWMDRWITEHYTAGEGEFFDLPTAEAAQRLCRGREEMRAATGILPRGFIAPAWLLGEEAELAVRETGFDYTTRIGGILDLRAGTAQQWIPARSLCYSVRAAWRRACSRVWNPALLAWLGDSPVIRIGLHPPDWDFPEIRAQILSLTKRALAGRKALTYESWLDSHAASLPR